MLEPRPPVLVSIYTWMYVLRTEYRLIDAGGLPRPPGRMASLLVNAIVCVEWIEV